MEKYTTHIIHIYTFDIIQVYFSTGISNKNKKQNLASNGQDKLTHDFWICS